jgi:hypothetical protein
LSYLPSLPISRLSRTLTLLFTAAAAVLLAACGPSEQEQVLEARNQALSTQFTGLQASATVEADRLQVTLDFVATEVARVGTQRGRMIATLQDRGVDTSQIPAPNLAGNPTPAATNPINPISNPTQALTAPAVTNVQITPASPTPDTSGQPRLDNIVTAVGVNPDTDCASGVQTQFASSAPQIYVVANAYNIPQGATLLSRWLRDGAQVAAFDFVPDSVVDGSCVWFYAEPVDFAFTPGAYSVALEVNGAVLAQAAFTITE